MSWFCLWGRSFSNLCLVSSLHHSLEWSALQWTLRKLFPLHESPHLLHPDNSAQSQNHLQPYSSELVSMVRKKSFVRYPVTRQCTHRCTTWAPPFCLGPECHFPPSFFDYLGMQRKKHSGSLRGLPMFSLMSAHHIYEYERHKNWAQWKRHDQLMPLKQIQMHSMLKSLVHEHRWPLSKSLMPQRHKHTALTTSQPERSHLALNPCLQSTIETKRNHLSMLHHQAMVWGRSWHQGITGTFGLPLLIFISFYSVKLLASSPSTKWRWNKSQFREHSFGISHD